MFWIFLILAIVQGATEFLPVSSSGHLELLYDWFGLEMDTMALSILLHISTLISVLIYYRKEVLQLITHPLCPTNKKLLVSTVVTVGIVLVIKPLIDLLFTSNYLFVFFIITAFMLITSDLMTEKHNTMSRIRQLDNSSLLVRNVRNIMDLPINYKQAIIVGGVQAIACIPGISRSGSTISLLNIMGVRDSSTYSFLMSIPIIIGSMIMELLGGFTLNISVGIIIVAMLVATRVGYFAIGIVNKFVKKNNLSIFAYYLIILSSVLVLMSFVK